ncbi:hypothetical protein PJP10_12645 [Mycobacterium kansasii]
MFRLLDGTLRQARAHNWEAVRFRFGDELTIQRRTARRARAWPVSGPAWTEGGSRTARRVARRTTKSHSLAYR